MAIARVETLDEFRQVLVTHRLLLERVVDVGAVVVVPDLLRPRVRAGFPVVEENHVGLDPLGIEHAGRQTQYRVQVGVFQELLANGLARAAFEQHVVRNDHGGASGGLPHRANVLHEIELLVRGARPEVLTVVGQFVLLLFSLLVGEGHGTLLAEGRIGKLVVEALAGIGHERIVRRNGRRAVDLADVVQEHVH